MKTSGRFQFDWNDLKSFAGYVLAVTALWFTQNTIGIQDFLVQDLHISQSAVVLGMAFAGIFFKKYVQDNSK